MARVSVTKGACGTEKRQNFSVLCVVGFKISLFQVFFIASSLRKPSAALSPSVASRQLPPGGSHGFVKKIEAQWWENKAFLREEGVTRKRDGRSLRD